LRSTFNSSRLVRLVGDWAPVEVEAGMDFAERMSLWFGALDAIRLQAAQQSLRAIKAAEAGQRADTEHQVRALVQDFQRVRTVLAAAIAEGGVAADGRYAPYRERHLQLQRHMDDMIVPLGDRARQALSRASAGLRQLVALDAALQEVLAPRADKLLPTLPGLIERRFEQLRLDNQLESFEKDWRQALLAELDLRLEPVAGLIDALSKERDLQQ
jgi:hypothetical protein